MRRVHRFDCLERFGVDARRDTSRPRILRGETCLDIRIVDDCLHLLEELRRLLVGQHAHVERRLRFRRDHVETIAAVEDVGRDRRAQHRRVLRLVLEQPVVGRRAHLRVRRQHVAVLLRRLRRRDRRQAAEVGAGGLVQAHVGTPLRRSSPPPPRGARSRSTAGAPSRGRRCPSPPARCRAGSSPSPARSRTSARRRSA